MLGGRLLAFGIALGVLLAVPLLGVPAAPADAPAGLTILLTNDDGFDAPGIQAMRRALRDAGHRVIVVAPHRNRSSSSVSLTTRGTIRLRRVEPDLYAVEGTPADCVRVALISLLEDPVDLVISGVNFGQNVGVRTSSSGTVGAAITAASLGVPAIAVSQAVDPIDVRGTHRFFPDASAFTVDLVEALVARQVDPLLPPWIALNVNHPSRHRAEVEGVRLTRQGRSRLYELRYERAADGAVGVAFARGAVDEPVEDADTTALAGGYVSVTPLDGDWTAVEEVRPGLELLARDLSAALEASRPPPP
jgi:5'/3'-nucleotidase SurE